MNSKNFDNDQKELSFIFKLSIVVFTLLFSIQFSLAQQDSSADVLSISTIPTCVDVFGANQPQTQSLCGPNGQFQEVADIRLNIQVGNNVIQGDSELIFTAFPPPGQTSTTPISSGDNACSQTAIGQNCTVFPSPITITWKTHSVAAGYSLSKIVDGIPLAYLSYKAPFWGGEDDEDMNWFSWDNVDKCNPKAGSVSGLDTGGCVFGCNTPQSSVSETPCLFQGAGAFIRNVQAPGSECSDISVSSNIAIKWPDSFNSKSPVGQNLNCGANQVELFGLCGGFIEECGGTVLSVINANQEIDSIELPQCSCFGYNLPNSDLFENGVGQQCLRVLKVYGMHTTNGHNYLDQSCSSGQNFGLLVDKLVANYPNLPVATCRHMSYVLALQNSTSPNNVQPLSNMPPFVSLQPGSVCYTYLFSNTPGCGAPNRVTVTSTGSQRPECFYDSGATPRYTKLYNLEQCMNSNYGWTGNGDYNDKNNPENPCQEDWRYQGGSTSPTCDGNYAPQGPVGGCKPESCIYSNRFGPAFPLTGQPPEATKNAPPNENFPLDNQICAVCLAEYTNSAYLPGLWGLQRKLKRLIEDWRDSWIGAYSVPDFTNANNARSGSLPSNGTLGFNYYILQPTEGPPQIFILQPVWSQQLLQSCSPSQSGDTCWSSFNQPPDFFPSGSSNAAQADISTQNFETFGGVGSSNGIQYKKRGLSITAFWISPDCQNADSSFCGGHIYRCGHYCDLSFSEGFTSSNIPEREPKQPITDLLVAKGFTGLGPLSTAYLVSRQAKIITGIDFTVSYTTSDGQSVSQVLTLTTDNIGGGNSVAYINANGTGIVGRINNINTQSGINAPILGGVLVVSGTNSNPSVNTGSIFGQLNDKPSSFTENPYSKLTELIQQLESPNQFPGITGYQPGGCVMPIATFMTTLQCFSVGTACAAPYDLCNAIYTFCQNNQDWCNARDIVPIKPGSISDPFGTASYQVSPCSSLTSCDDSLAVTCNINTVDSIKGVGWYWLDPTTTSAFGTNCGQYGMNPWTFGKDIDTQYYICQESSSTQKNGVPCVPGISENTRVPSPCQVLGTFAKFHGQSGNNVASILASSSATKQNACFTSGQINLFQSTQESTTSNQPLATGCNSNFANLGNVPVVGLPTNWNYNNPSQWVNQNYLLDNGPDITAFLDISLFVSGYGLNAELTTVSNAIFVNQDNICIIFQDSISGQANLTVQNIGAIPAQYTVDLINCTDYSGTYNGPIGSIVGSPPTNNIDPGQIVAFQVGLSFPALNNIKALRCFFKVSPAAYTESIVLDSVAINCNVAGFLQQSGWGQFGNDGLLLNPNPPTNNGCENNPGFLCWLVYGGLLGHVTFWIVIVLLSISTVYFIVFIVKYLKNQNKYEDMVNRTKEQEKKVNEVKAVIQQEEETEKIKLEEQLRQEAFQQNLPIIAQTIKEINTP